MNQSYVPNVTRAADAARGECVYVLGSEPTHRVIWPVVIGEQLVKDIVRCQDGTGRWLSIPGSQPVMRKLPKTFEEAQEWLAVGVDDPRISMHRLALWVKELSYAIQEVIVPGDLDGTGKLEMPQTLPTDYHRGIELSLMKTPTVSGQPLSWSVRVSIALRRPHLVSRHDDRWLLLVAKCGSRDAAVTALGVLAEFFESAY